MATAKQLAARKLFAARSRAGTLRTGVKKRKANPAKVAPARKNPTKAASTRKNPIVKSERNSDAARYAELYGGAPKTIRAWNDHYIVRYTKPGEKLWTLAASFPQLEFARVYARAFSRAHPTYTVSLITPD